MRDLMRDVARCVRLPDSWVSFKLVQHHFSKIKENIFSWEYLVGTDHPFVTHFDCELLLRYIYLPYPPLLLSRRNTLSSCLCPLCIHTPCHSPISLSILAVLHTWHYHDHLINESTLFLHPDMLSGFLVCSPQSLPQIHWTTPTPWTVCHSLSLPPGLTLIPSCLPLLSWTNMLCSTRL